MYACVYVCAYPGRLIMDEVDLILHPLKSELNFPIGRKQLLGNRHHYYVDSVCAFDGYRCYRVRTTTGDVF